MIDKNKQYRTKHGREVRIYAVDGDGEMPIHGAVLNEIGWSIQSWSSDGKWCPNMNDDLDLIEVKPRIKRDVWVNVYPDGRFGQLLKTKEEADRFCALPRIACVRLTIDCEEGEGL